VLGLVGGDQCRLGMSRAAAAWCHSEIHLG
jgi:hypothetical protein